MKRARKLFSFGWKLLASALLDTGYRGLSDLIIGKQFTTTALGFVSQGKKYPQALGALFDGSIQPVMLSAISKVQGNPAHVKSLTRRAIKTSTFVIAPAMVCLAVVAEPLVGLILGEQWLPCVPFLRMYCFTSALLPIHTSNLQTLNGIGRSDLFLKLEVIKKGYGVPILCFTAFVLNDIYAIVIGYMISGVIGTIVNSWPNKRTIGYSYSEQIKDIFPAFLFSVIAGSVAYLVGMFPLIDVALIVLQVAVMIGIYLGASMIFKLEAFIYLKETVKEIINGKLD
jgi:O-antigen/teichoic acid export membrane protein